MRRLIQLGLIAGMIALAAPTSGSAQEQDFMAVGEMAPDIEFTGATRYGVLPETMNLSDFRGETVVLAFFFRARTPG
jgi:hypothetical protein